MIIIIIIMIIIVVAVVVVVVVVVVVAISETRFLYTIFYSENCSYIILYATLIFI
jgi:hypothetical protein